MMFRDIILLVFLDGNACYNQIFRVEKDASKTTFICPGFVGLFEWVVMTYQRAMNLIFHDLIGMVIEVYIDDIVIKSAPHASHLADLHLLLKRYAGMV
jgi:hypothetical protein